MSDPVPASRPVSPAAAGVLAALVAVACAGVVVWRAEDRALAAQLSIGLFAADLALAGLRWDEGPRAWVLRGSFAVLNIVVVGAACLWLGDSTPAWLLAVPVALAAPRRLLGSEQGRALKLTGLAAAVGVGQSFAGLAPETIAASVLALASLAVAPYLLGPGTALVEALEHSRRERDRALETTSQLRARLADDSARIQESQRELTATFERRMASAAAHQAEILAAVVDAVMTVDDAGVIRTANDAANHLLHAQPDELPGQRLDRFLPQANAETLSVLGRTTRRAVLAGGKAQMRELTCIPQSGPQLEVEMAVGMIVERDDEASERLTYTLVLRDISKRKEVERFKDELVATVSHELRTPLTAILGALKLLRGGAVGAMPDKAGDLLSLAHRNGMRLVSLINDILDIQKMQEGKMAFEMRRCEIATICATAVEAARPMGQSVAVDYVFEAARPLPEVWADAGRIEQVVANLLSNATKYSPRDSTVRVSVSARDHERVRVVVRDEGPGLSETMAGRVFERFVQGQSGDTRVSGGTGLGLTIARSIVERHGGEIGVDSVEGEGASFYFELPSANLLQRGKSGPLDEARKLRS